MLTIDPAPRPLGASDIRVSPIAWGMWRLKGSVPNARTLVEAALDAGITLFDTADIYGADTPAGFGSAEALFGAVLAEAPSLRDRMVIATKGASGRAIPIAATRPILRRPSMPRSPGCGSSGSTCTRSTAAIS